MRLFVALNLPDDVRARIVEELLTPLGTRLPGVRWVRPESLHVTLAFLGERSEAEAREAHAAVRDAAGTRGPLHVTLTGLGVFPAPDRPKVLWLGLSDPAPVRELHRAFERTRARLGVPAEGRAYHPHVTLGRVPPAAESDVQRDLEGALEGLGFTAEVTLQSLDLMRSQPGQAGLRYSTLLAAPLARAESR